MKNIIIRIVLVFLCVFIAVPAYAYSPTDKFANCLVDTLNGKERKILAKWIFFAIAAHPEIKSYSKTKANDIEESDKFVGKLVTRLLTVDCASELKEANQTNPLAVQQGFELVGKVAMQELMTNQNVTKAITNYAKFADLNKINKILSEK